MLCVAISRWVCLLQGRSFLAYYIDYHRAIAELPLVVEELSYPLVDRHR